MENIENVVKIDRLFDLGHLINQYLVPFGLKVIVAIAIWIIGGFVINGMVKVARRALVLRKFESTIVTYASSALHVILRAALIMIILEVCGIPTTSFAAILGAVGVAIGVAWSGLLSNFAAGIFLVVLRPFKVGDYIGAAGQTGTVAQIGLFVTKLTADNNIMIHIGNNKIFSDIIINYSTNDTRRGDFRFQIAHGVDVEEAMSLLLNTITNIPGVLTTPAPTVTVIELNASGIALSIRFYATTPTFWATYNAANKAIAKLYTEGRWPAPASFQFNLAQKNDKDPV